MKKTLLVMGFMFMLVIVLQAADKAAATPTPVACN